MPSRVRSMVRVGSVVFACLVAFAIYAPGVVPAFWTRYTTGVYGRPSSPLDPQTIDIFAVAPQSAGAAAGIKRGDRLVAAGPNATAALEAAGVRRRTSTAQDLRVSVMRGTRTLNATIKAPLSQPFLNAVPASAIAMRLIAYFLILLVSAALAIWEPSPATWLLLLFVAADGPTYATVTFLVGIFDDVPRALARSLVTFVFCWTAFFAVLPLLFLCFPQLRPAGWRRKVFPAVALMCVLIFAADVAITVIRGTPNFPSLLFPISWLAVVAQTLVIVMASYLTASLQERPKLQWAFIGIGGALISTVLAAIALDVYANQSVGQWVSVFSLALPAVVVYTLIHRRVVNPVIALNRSVIYGALTTFLIAVLEGVHWLVSRGIESEHYAFFIEGGVAIVLGIFIHRIYRTIETFTDRWLFRSRYLAEKHLLRVTAALPYATDRGEIDRALVNEPVRALGLTSAAAFWCHDHVFSLSDAFGWNVEKKTCLDENRDLIRYLKAEGRPLNLDTVPTLDRSDFPGGAEHPVVAIPIWIRHRLVGLALYGAHVNATVIDAGEVALLDGLAVAAATAHDHAEAERLREENDQLRAQLLPLPH